METRPPDDLKLGPSGLGPPQSRCTSREVAGGQRSTGPTSELLLRTRTRREGGLPWRGSSDQWRHRRDGGIDRGESSNSSRAPLQVGLVRGGQGGGVGGDKLFSSLVLFGRRRCFVGR
jgi:hypothetical protein